MREPRLSECCGAKALGDIHDTIGFCADCKEHAEFNYCCDLCQDPVPEDGLICGSCAYNEYKL